MTVNLNTGSLWWETIAGPSDFVSQVKSALYDGHSVVAEITSAFPYRWSFRDEVSHWIDQEEEIAVEHIDCRNEFQGGDIGKFIIQRLAPRQIVDYMRQPRPRFLKQRGVLAGKLIWVRSVQPEYFKAWLQFIQSYNSDSLKGGIFLLEMIEPCNVRSSQNLMHIAYPEYVKTDDVRLFASILADKYLKDETTGVKQYAVELATTLCWKDGELAESLLRALDIENRSPLDSLRAVYENEEQPCTRGVGIAAHPYEQLRKNCELDHQLWTAQIRTAYPIIELHRLELIQQWYDEIKQALLVPFVRDDGCPQSFIDSEKNPIDDPFNVEIGMLDSMLHKRKFGEEDQYLLYLPDQEDREYIRFLRDCRNSLAHLEVCEPHILYKLITGSRSADDTYNDP